MKLDSKYFDRIRVRPNEEKILRDRIPECDWPGCKALGRHPAPKGRDREGEYYHFCLEHVKQYNKSYNYFEGMADEDLREWLERNVTGHRPTWRVGANAWAFRPSGGRGPRSGGFRHNMRWENPFDLFGEDGAPRSSRPTRTLPASLLSALHALGLDESADRATIKAQYKMLVKRFHPDANGGSKENEERLREIINAYHVLRKANMC